MRGDHLAVGERHVAHDPAVASLYEIEHDQVGGFTHTLTVFIHPENGARGEQEPALDGGRNSPERTDHDVLLHARECRPVSAWVKGTIRELAVNFSPGV